MDNSFDKLNNEFADKATGGFKYWFWTVISYIFDIGGVIITIYSLFLFHIKQLVDAGTWDTKVQGYGTLSKINLYLCLLTLLCGLFSLQVGSWAKGTGKRTTLLKVSFIWGLIDAVAACVILYIVMPIMNG